LNLLSKFEILTFAFYPMWLWFSWYRWYIKSI